MLGDVECQRGEKAVLAGLSGDTLERVAFTGIGNGIGRHVAAFLLSLFLARSDCPQLSKEQRRPTTAKL